MGSVEKQTIEAENDCQSKLLTAWPPAAKGEQEEVGIPASHLRAQSPQLNFLQLSTQLLSSISLSRTDNQALSIQTWENTWASIHSMQTERGGHQQTAKHQ